MPSAMHQSLLFSIPGIQTKGFRKAVLAAIGDDCEDIDLRGKIPDGWRIDQENREIHCFEVEISHPIDEAALRIYADWWFDLDGVDWTLRLWCVDRFAAAREMGLGAWFHRLMQYDVKAKVAA